LKAIPIIAMTANVLQADIDRCIHAGMNDHIAKPIDPDELFSKLVKWVTPPKAGPPQEAAAFAPNPPATGRTIQESSEDLPQVPGLDTTLGLRRVMGKKTFYLDMLRMYVKNQGTAPEQIRNSLAGGDYDTSQRLAHTAKGVSGNIGATELQELASRVETALGDHAARETIEPLIDSFAAAHAKLIGALKEALPAPGEGEEETVALGQYDREQAVAACKELERLLANNDGDATDYINEARALLLGILGANRLQEIREATDAYDFQKARELLNQQVGA
jgi:two-component system sensor histidine kinase/response regulator